MATSSAKIGIEWMDLWFLLSRGSTCELKDLCELAEFVVVVFGVLRLDHILMNGWLLSNHIHPRFVLPVS